jgi:sugar lactone lactonase YvrE
VDPGGNVFVADHDNHTIRKIMPSGVVTTVAGAATLNGGTDNTGGAARFYYPFGLALDSATNLYVADSYNHTIRKMTPATVVTTVAGTAGVPGITDATGGAARFNYPTGVAVDSATNVYVADQGNHTIRMITPSGVVTTLAGSAGQNGSDNGFQNFARFTYPYGVAADAGGNVYVADTGNQMIRKILAGGFVTTLAGSAGFSGGADGNGASAQFSQPSALALDSAGNIYVADTFNSTIRKVTPGGDVTTLAGSAGQNGSTNGVGTAARFSYLSGIALDGAGRIVTGDTSNNRISKGPPLFQFLKSGPLSVSGGSFHAVLTGPFGSNVVLEASSNLQSWTPIQTNQIPPDGLNVFVPVGTNRNQSFRARLAP